MVYFNLVTHIIAGKARVTDNIKNDIPFRWASSNVLVLYVMAHWHGLLGHLMELSQSQNVWFRSLARMGRMWAVSWYWWVKVLSAGTHQLMHNTCNSLIIWYRTVYNLGAPGRMRNVQDKQNRTVEAVVAQPISLQFNSYLLSCLCLASQQTWFKLSLQQVPLLLLGQYFPVKNIKDFKKNWRRSLILPQ